MHKPLFCFAAAFALVISAFHVFAQQTVDNSTAVRVSPNPLKPLASFAGGCTFGDTATASDGTPGANVYICGSSHDWNLMSGAGGGTGATGATGAAGATGATGSAGATGATGAASGGTALSSGPYGSAPACNSAKFAYYPTDSTYTTILGSGSACSYFQNGKQVYPVVSANFGWQNQGGSSETYNAGVAELQIADTNSAVNWTMRVATIPAAPYTLTAIYNQLTGYADAQGTGIGITDGTKIATISYLIDNSSRQNVVASTGYGFCELRVLHISGASDGGTGVTLLNVPASVCYGPIALRITDNGTSVAYWYSLDGGSSFIQLGPPEGDTSYLTATKYGYLGTSVTGATPAFPFVQMNMISVKIQ